MIPVYIVTRDRVPGLRKVLPKWLDQKDVHVTLVVEPSEVNIHKEFASDRVAIFTPGKNLGMGGIRAAVFQKAFTEYHSAIIMADDDCFPADDVKPLMEFLFKHSKAIGIGAIKSGYGHFIGEGMDSGRPILHTGSVGRQLAAWNVHHVLEVGNVDKKLDLAFEDNELCVRGIAGGYPWYLHAGVMAKQTAKRFSPGGIITQAGSLEKRMEGVRRCHEYVFEKHGARYVSKPGGPFRFYWTRMLDDRFGDKWRKYLHTGVMK